MEAKIVEWPTSKPPHPHLALVVGELLFKNQNILREVRPCHIERHPDPPKVAKKVFVPKNVLCFESHAKKSIFLIFSFNKNFISSVWDIYIFGKPDSETLTGDTR